MERSGSIAIANALLTGRGLTAVAAGLFVLLASSAAHANLAHSLAALVFALCILGLRELRRVDNTLLSMPWSVAGRITDLVSLLLLCAATFGPLFIIATGGHVHWDLAVLAGALIIWWHVLDSLVADYRRVWRALAAIGIAWLPLVIVRPSLMLVAEVVLPLAGLAVAHSAITLWKTLGSVPAQYRKLRLGTD